MLGNRIYGYIFLQLPIVIYSLGEKNPIPVSNTVIILPKLAQGIGGAGFAISLEKYRPIFTSIAVIFLGIAFYYTYRKKETSCEIDSVCAAPKGGRPNKVILWVATALVGFFIAFPYLLGLHYQVNQFK